MSPENISLKRQELYEKVWTTPMQKLAKEFGLSDVGLAKLCRRHEIPFPGRGYWARVQFGQKPPRAILPTLKEPGLDAIAISPSEPRSREAIVIEERETVPTVFVAEDRSIGHPKAHRIERSTSRRAIDVRGVLDTRQRRTLPLKLTTGALSRSLRIIDAFFSALDDAKYGLEWPSPYTTPLKIVVDSERLHFMIKEAIERSQHKPTKEELTRQKTDTYWRPPQWDYMPTGRLNLTLESCEYPSISRSWSDGKRRKLDTCLGETLVACKKMAEAIKQERVDRAEAERLRREEEKRRIEESIRKAEYDRKAKAVNSLVQQWQESKLLRAFTAALQSTATEAQLSDETKKQLETMIEWSARHADYVDPLTDLKWTLGQFKNPPWHFED